MEEKRKDSGIPPPAISATVTPSKPLEIPSPELPSIRRRGGGQKRKASNLSGGNTANPTTTSLKRQAREKFSAVPFPQIHNGPCTRARQQPNNGAASPSSSAAVVNNELEAVEPPEVGGGEAVKVVEELNEVKEDWEALEAKIEAEYEAIRSRGANAHVVPNHCGWFSWTKIHPLEEGALSSFFNGKLENRTPEIYLEIRNWIMSKFHANPNTQIELKDLYELSVGDFKARQEVMEFLDYWGLINYHPFIQTDAVAAVSADADKVAKTGSLIEKLYRFETEQSSPVVPRSNMTTPAVPSGLLPESAIAEELVKSEGPAVEYHCNSCSADCSRKRYHCQKQADFDLCAECFNNGKFGSDMFPSDFILMEHAEAAGVSGGKWTDQETILLLEALELFKENWNEIAEHVATKTKTQCILHFVQMSIEDRFLDGGDETGTNLKENADPLSTNDDTSSPKDAPETTENKDIANDNQSLSSPMKISKPEDTSEPNISQESGENCALKALREAFEVTDSFPLPGEHFSFAEAGNPVMALAAFLVRLVEPNIVTASARSSLKSISCNSSGEQLAARHCFLLEDPPDDKKKSADSDRAAVGTMEQESQKDENQNDGKQSETKSNSLTDESGPSNDQNDEKGKDSVTEEKELSISPDGDCTDKSHSLKEADGIAPCKDVEPSLLNESDNPDLPKQVRSTAEGSDDITLKVELPQSSENEPGNGASLGGPSQSSEALKDEDMIVDSVPLEKEPKEPITSNSMVEDEAKTGEEEAKDCKNENEDPLETNNDFSIDKIKCAAVTAISAAAVKAKLLANQEEEQIRQLATLLIEKQLHKLETKMAFFNEMENVVMRVREQLERSKQKLYHERAQIIATRLGMSGSSSRPMPQSLPINRAAMTYANSAPRPPMSMNSQRPPISRPMMASAPTSNPFAPATAPGSSIQPTYQDKHSSFGMK